MKINFASIQYTLATGHTYHLIVDINVFVNSIYNWHYPYINNWAEGQQIRNTRCTCENILI